MQPQTKLWLAVALVLTGLFGGLYLANRQPAAAPAAAPTDPPLAAWVRLERAAPARFPLLFVRLQRHGSTDPRVWDAIFRREVAGFGEPPYFPARLGDRLPGTAFTLVAAHWQPPAHQDQLAEDDEGATVTLADAAGQRVTLVKERPAAEPAGATAYELVFLPVTPLRTSGSAYVVRRDGELKLAYGGREEVYRLQLDAQEQPVLQRLAQGQPTGAPVPLLPYREAEHVEWLRRHGPAPR